MDRIYYFLIAKEKGAELPVFRMETELHQVYYLQMHEAAADEDLPGIQAYMAKAAERIAGRYEEECYGLTYMVYSAAFEKWLKKRQKESYWKTKWNLPFYQEYGEVCNLLFLLQKVPKECWPKHLVIVGETVGLQSWIQTVARYMNRVTIFSTDEPNAFEELREQLLEEYGLLVSWKQSIHPVSEVPAFVIDYSGKEKIYIWGIPRGSVWVDMTSIEVRRHGIQDRDTGISYISLKSFWQEEMSQTLDTANKILYNTEVKLEGKVGL